ncbi:MAG: glycosyltransferase family 39 protein [Anaerolineae bacterium]|nr:glycosyltransferase family 39 protein [Anaerolineae bacterium]
MTEHSGRFLSASTPYRALAARALALLAAACMVASAYGFRPQLESLVHYRPTPGPKDYYAAYAPWAFAVGALLLIAALALGRAPGDSPGRDAPRLAALRPRWAWALTAPGLLALAIVTEANAALSDVGGQRALSHHAQAALLAGGILLVALGLGGVGRPALRRHSAREAVLLLALTAASLGLRAVHLGDAVRVMVDESHFALGATYFRDFPDVKLLTPMPTSASFPFVFSYGQAELVALIGRNLAGLRALSAILGALTVPALYLLGRALYGRRTALIAALLLLTFPPHLHYSRLALNNIADPLFGTLALGLLAWGWRTGRRMGYALSGVALGLTQYFYEGGRILYPLLAASWLAAGFACWRPRPSARGVLLALVAFVIIAAPVYITLATGDHPLLDRLDKAELDDLYWDSGREPDTPGARLARFRHSLLHYVNSPENTLYHYYLYYGGEHALVLSYAVPALLLGGVFAAWRWRTPGVLPLVWLLGTSAGNALLVESAVTARYVVVFPALALLIALGVSDLLALLWPRRWPRAVQTALALILALALAVPGATYYFGPFLETFNVEVRQHVAYDVEDALLRAADSPPGTHVYLLVDGPALPQSDAQRLLNFLADDLQATVSTPDEFTAMLDALPRDADLAIFFPPGDNTTLARLTEAFGPRPVTGSPHDVVPAGKALWLFYVPAAE